MLRAFLLAAAVLVAGVHAGAAEAQRERAAAGPQAVLAAGATASARAADPVVGLSVRELAGQRVIFGFEGSRPPAKLRERIRRGQAAGIILFKRQIPSRSALRSLVRSLQSIRRPAGLRDPLLIMIDQEGGLVKRLDGAPDLSPAQIGRTGDPDVARSQGRAAARNLADAEVNVDLAPVLDVGRPGTTTAQTGRSFGSSPGRVAELGAAFARGLRQGGVAATAKHFPGIGLAVNDEDLVAARIGLSRSKLRSVDERPFAAAVKGGIPMVMLSTAVYPAFDSRPALFSQRLATTELRGRLGFTGVSITDDLEVPSVARFGSPGRRALMAAGAGNDLLLFAQTYGAGASGAEALVDAVKHGDLTRAQLEQSATRVLALRASLGSGR